MRRHFPFCMDIQSQAHDSKDVIASTPIRHGNLAFTFYYIPLACATARCNHNFHFFLLLAFPSRENDEVRLRQNAKGGALFQWYRLTAGSHTISFVYFYCSEPIIGSYSIIFPHLSLQNFNLSFCGGYAPCSAFRILRDDLLFRILYIFTQH